jgi:hypothetical protein
MRRAVGIDFGTTNSALALVGSNGPELAQFSHEGGLTKTFRSILYFEAPTPESREKDQMVFPMMLPSINVSALTEFGSKEKADAISIAKNTNLPDLSICRHLN